MVMPGPAFSFTLHGAVAYPAGSSFPPRLMPDFEIVWVIDGQVTWVVDGRHLKAPPGTVIIVAPGTRDAFVWDPQAITRHAYLHFAVDALGDLPPTRSWPALSQPPAGDVVRPLLSQVLDLLSRRPAGWRPLANAALAHVIRSLCAGHLGGAILAALPVPLNNMLHFVRTRWQDGTWSAITLGELARHAGVGRVHLCRLMHATCGRGVLAALRDLRLDRAAALLQRSDLPIGEVAKQSGFDDAFHFSRCFRIRHGRSPRAWRQAPHVMRPDPGLATLSAWMSL